MALRLRRSITLSSVLLKQHHFSAIPSSSPLPIPSPLTPTTRGNANRQFHLFARSPSLFFRSSSLSTSSRWNDNDDRKISPDEILFEGCDYNHWLITMEFPKDPKPTPEEMVETYVQTLAKVVGSVEEAKKRMYACSTTTYTGFQAVMTEEMSEKFRGLPGVVFILPDSYIDPVNKEYGGDKYINGTIIPRPPPVQYGRQGRYGDRNRISDRQRYDRPRDPMPMQQGNATYDRQSSMQGDGRNYVPYDRQGSMQGDGRNYVPQQNYGPTGQDGRNYGPPASRDFNPAMGRGDFGQGERRDYRQAGGRDSYAQGGRRDPMPMGRRDYPPGGSDNFQVERRDSVPSSQRDSNQVERRDSVPSYQRDSSQGDRGNFVPPEQSHFSQGERRDYAPPERRDFRGDFQHATHSGSVDYGQGMTSGYGQGNSGPTERQTFSQVEHRDGMQGEHRNFMP